MNLLDRLLEKNLIPDPLLRWGIRRLLAQRLREEDRGDLEHQQAHEMSLVEALRKSPIAIRTEAANAQHYEVPTAFYQAVLGPRLKYSCGYWREGVTRLEQSEEDMLALTTERAELSSGQRVLELGCGWGSLSLFMAERFPQSTFVAVSNSRTQKLYIDSQIQSRGLRNLSILTADMNDFEISQTFDRVVSVEMFEHMRNYERLLRKIAGWLTPDGKLFVHIFTHKTFTYFFEAKDETDWMSRYFFTGGIMPSDHLLLYFAQDLAIERHWRLNGQHYQKTSEAWLRNMDRRKAELLPLFSQTYGPDQAVKWWAYWRVFFMSCAELWGYRKGTEWFVSHYLFQKKRVPA